MKKPIFLGIDPSLTGTGLVRFRDPGRVQTVSTVDPKHHRGIERLCVIKEAIEDLMDAEQASYIVAMEGYAYGTRGNHFDKGELGGVVKMMMLLAPQPVTMLIVPPTNLKMYATGNGAAKKPEVQAAIENHLQREFKDDNQSDAAVLGCMAHTWWSGETWGPRQEEAMKKKVYPCFPPRVPKQSAHPVRRRRKKV